MQLEEHTIQMAGKEAEKIMSYLSETSADFNLTTDCSSSLIKLVSDFKQLKWWAVQMLDASGKQSGGLMNGVYAFYGDYDQCLKIRVNRDKSTEEYFRGQYCLVDFKLPLPKKDQPYYYKSEMVASFANYAPQTQLFRSLKMKVLAFYNYGLRHGACLPSTCSLHDVRQIISAASSKLLLNGSVLSCEVLTPSTWDMPTIVTLVVLGSFILIVITMSLVDAYLLSDLHTGMNHDLIRAFSISRNTKNWLGEKAGPKADNIFSHFHGIRFLSLAWVILSHTAYWATPIARSYPVSYESISGNVWFQFVMTGFASVDSFFLISAILSSYAFVMSVDKHGSKTLNYPVKIFRRIWRLLPPAMLALGLLFVLPHLNNGPMWDSLVVREVRKCTTNWWTLVTFTQNLFDPSNICMSHYWYVAMTMQFFLATLVYFAIFLRSEKLANIFLIILFLTTPITMISLGLWMDFPPTIHSVAASYRSFLDFLRYTYLLPYAHVSIHAMGLYIGAWLARRKGKLQLSIGLKTIGWIVSFAMGSLILYGPHSWHKPNGIIPSTVETALYLGLHRIGWGFYLSWVILYCISTKGGILESILSWKAFSFLNVPSYMVYLIHVHVMRFVFGSARGTVDMDKTNAVFGFAGFITCTYFLAAILYLLFEAPLIQLDKVVFKTKATKEAENSVDKIDSTIKLDKLVVHLNGINPENVIQLTNVQTPKL